MAEGHPIRNYFPNIDAALLAPVEAAYDIAAETLRDRTRGNGRPFLDHPVGVAKIASEEIGLPPECLAAVFLHEAMRFSDTLDPAVFLQQYGAGRGTRPLFGRDIMTMAEGLNKISTIKPKDTRLEADNYKKLIVSYSRDPRVTVLKIADRLEVMRSLDLFPKTSRERKVLETLMLYIPLAHQLGLYNIKSEMEDIYFRAVEPEQYRAITNKLRSTAGDRERLLSQFIEPLKQTLSDAGISYKLKVRTKTAYSIWRKMVKQDVPFEGVYDVFAIRFIIDCDGDSKAEKDICWDVYSYVTAEYETDTNRLRDWLSKPKPNGYESLHITVKNRDGASLEVQIRTKRMDEIAESGLASHWSYKGIRSEAALDSWLKSVRNILEHPDTGREAAYQDYELPDPPVGEIFVFTPSGELRKLPEGASVLDFAFGIHTNLGMRCTGAKVNGRPVSIREKLHTGDVVEIMSGRNQKPSSDWLNYVVSSKARARIKRHLSEMEFRRAAEGKELLERRLKNWKLELTDEQLGIFMKQKTPYKTLNAFYAAVGEGTVDIADIRSFIRNECGEGPAGTASGERRTSGTASPAGKASGEPDRKASVPAQPQEAFAGASGGSDDLCIVGTKDLRNLDYRMAKCCNPVFGDDVFGFVSIRDGIKIHRISCPNAARLMDMYPYRIRKIRWSDNPSTGTFQTNLRIIAEHDASVVNGIMAVVGSFKASVRNFSVTENERMGTYDINLKISVPSSLELDKVISQIRALKPVTKVTRS